MDGVVTRTIGLQQVVESLPDQVAVFRLVDDGLVMLVVNETFAQGLSASPRDLAGRRLGEVAHRAVVEAGVGLVTEALEGQLALRREIDLDVRGRQRVLDVTMVPMSDREVLAITRDLTEVRRTAAALDETQAIARIGHWAWDMQADRISWTDELYRIFGIDPETWEATYDSYLRLIHPEDRAEFQERIGTAIRNATAYTVQHRVVRPDGSVRVISAIGEVVTGRDGTAVRIAGTAQDITERVEAQEEAIRLREAHARHERGLELNDNVMQGLAISRLALMEGDHDRALDALDGAMEAVRAIIRSLREARLGGAQALEAGDLVRTRGALEERS